MRCECNVIVVASCSRRLSEHRVINYLGGNNSRDFAVTAARLLTTFTAIGERNGDAHTHGIVGRLESEAADETYGSL